MGLKFKKFKAKLNWKTKETVPDVVCLRYQIHSEFEEPLRVPVPTTSSTELGTNDVIKHKKPAIKPPIQNIFETNSSIKPTAPSPKISTSNTVISNITKQDVNANNINHTTKTNENAAAAGIEPTLTKGILKKSTPEENIVIETKSNQNNTSDSDDHKKSALIFMTESHDDGELPTKENNFDPVEEVTKLNSKTTVISHQEVETGEIKFRNVQKVEEAVKLDFHTKENEDKNIIIRERDSESEQADIKNVRWRETVMEINPPNYELDTQKSEESVDDFKVHFVKYQNPSRNGLQSEAADTEESESEDNDQPQVNSYYGSRASYSSQAASIFFAGEEPEPTLRVRNVSQQQEDDVNSNNV